MDFSIYHNIILLICQIFQNGQIYMLRMPYDFFVVVLAFRSIVRLRFPLDGPSIYFWLKGEAIALQLDGKCAALRMPTFSENVSQEPYILAKMSRSNNT